MEHDFTAPQKATLERLMSFMLGYNEKVNLTRITAEDEVWEKHFTDSVLPLDLFNVPRGTNIIDVGTGAGFPGAVWSVCREDLNITLLDSLRKRTDYLSALAAEIGLSYSVLNGRAEELACDVRYREVFDIAVSRAVANLPALLEYMLPFVKVGGYALAMKGKDDETERAANAIAILGGELAEVIRYELPSGDSRSLVVVKKISQIPAKYPRKAVNISKNPL